MMEEEEGNMEGTPPLEPRRHELLTAAVGEDNTPAAAVSTHMNFEGSRIFFSTNTRPFRWWRKVISRGLCRSGGHQPVDAPKYYGSFIGERSRCSSTISGKQSSNKSSTGRAKCGTAVKRKTQ